ncbi:MAG: MmcQ/YjbR family DNA-binding protein [Phycisphaerales bacterium]
MARKAAKSATKPAARPRAAKAPADKRTTSRSEELQDFCRSLPDTTEDIKWGDNLIFSIRGKMYAGFDTDESGYYSFKCTEDDFDTLTEREGIIPAPYAARYFWVAVRQRRALSAAEARKYLRKAYDTILEANSRKRSR